MWRVACILVFGLFAAIPQAEAAPCAGFEDVEDSDPFCTYVTWMKQNGVTLGCTTSTYCPADFVTRLQMAAFMNRLANVMGDITGVAAGVGLTGGGTSGELMLGIANQGVNTAQLADASVTLAKLASMGCGAGQVLKFNGAGWACAADATGGGGTVTQVATGAGLTGGPITASGTIGLAQTQLLPTSACSNGQVAKWNGTAWQCAADGAPANVVLQGGNSFGAAMVVGTTDSYGLALMAGSGLGLVITPPVGGIAANILGGTAYSYVAGVKGIVIGGGGASLNSDPNIFNEGPNQVWDSFSTIGGGSNNRTGSQDVDVNNAAFGTIAGGNGNEVTASYGTIGGGYDNEAGDSAFVGGGQANIASGGQSGVVGGQQNEATGFGSFVGGGRFHVAAGAYSMIPGGYWSETAGSYAFAGGRRAKANATGCFVWADSVDADFTCGTSNRFLVRSTGGVFFVTQASPQTGVFVAAGSGTWNSISDRAAKSNIAPVDSVDVLERLAAVPVSIWNYSAQPEAVRHIGPMADDFHAAFGVGDDPRAISVVDAQGVALAAIQGLHKLVREKDEEIGGLRRELEALKDEVRRIAAGR